MAPLLLLALPAGRCCVADAAYDSNALRQMLLDQGTLPVIPNNPTRKRRHPFDPLAYRMRNLIERAFCRRRPERSKAQQLDATAARVRHPRGEASQATKLLASQLVRSPAQLVPCVLPSFGQPG